MTFLDYLVLIVVAASVASGAVRGIIKALFSLLSAILGLVAATYFYEYAALLVVDMVETRRAANLVGFFIVFLTVLVSGSLLSLWMRKGIRRARLDWIDHALGAGFGLLRGWLICSVVYLALTAFPVKIEAVEQAVFAPMLLEGTRVIAAVTSSELREKFFDGYSRVKDIWQKES